MQDPPNAAELVGAVRDHLAETLSRAAPAASPERLAFTTRVAVNVLGIVERELRLGPEADSAEHARLRDLLGRDGTAEELNRELCRRIRAGEIAIDAPELLAHLRAATMAKLAIDQPRYSSYIAELRGEGGSAGA